MPPPIVLDLAPAADHCGIAVPACCWSGNERASSRWPRLAPDDVRSVHASLHHFVAQSPWSDADMLRQVRNYVLPAMQKKVPVTAGPHNPAFAASAWTRRGLVEVPSCGTGGDGSEGVLLWPSGPMRPTMEDLRDRLSRHAPAAANASRAGFAGTGADDHRAYADSKFPPSPATSMQRRRECNGPGEKRGEGKGRFVCTAPLLPSGVAPTWRGSPFCPRHRYTARRWRRLRQCRSAGASESEVARTTRRGPPAGRARPRTRGWSAAH